MSTSGAIPNIKTAGTISLTLLLPAKIEAQMYAHVMCPRKNNPYSPRLHISRKIFQTKD